MRLAFVPAVLLLITGCNPEVVTTAKEIQIAKSLNGLEAAVACAHPEAAAIGARVLADGGNAIDAAVAVQWALAVCFPEAGNIGGGGFMVVRLANGTATTLDFREKSPEKSSAEMFLDEFGEVVPGKSTESPFAVGVPGTVRGLYDAHEKYGRMAMDSLILPAVGLAAKGFPVTATQASELNENADIFRAANQNPTAFAPDNKTWKAGDTLRQPELAATLQRISTKGPNEFYTGETAQILLAQMADDRGIITAADLANYHTVWRKPIMTENHGYRTIGMAPPSSGGIAVGQIMGMLYDCLGDRPTLDTADFLHAMVEIERRVYADRSEHLGDPDFYEVSQDALLDPLYLRRRMENFNWEQATPSTEISPGTFAQVAESMETTHLSVVDGAGNAVSVTTTLNGLYGSKIVVTGAGFLLNNEMDDFSAKPGTPNMFGLVGGAANAIAPGKRMLSSMSPVIVEKGDDLFLVAGSPGGSTIITSVMQTIMNTTYFGMSLEEAIAAPKFHSQWLPDVVYVEKGRFSGNMLNELRRRGHTIEEIPSLGRVDAIMLNSDRTLQAVGDPRWDDSAAGY